MKQTTVTLIMAVVLAFNATADDNRVSQEDYEAYKWKTEGRAKALAEARRSCSAIYKATADKKIKDWTVKEGNAIKACRQLGLFK